MKKEEKTNVMRILDAKKIEYTSHTYTADPTLTGEDIAAILGEEPEQVFKTLVTRGKTGAYYVFAVPVNAGLDLKKAARAAGEKSVEMIKQKELLPLTGYVHGGCSPIGMKKAFRTFIHETAILYDTICVSGGKVGCQIELSPADLIDAASITTADVAGDA
ncbi:MAG: Cys-tRNA(Pro) deacylase [Oscillospiraceae bacterium]|nr:Cys-tRNA(Pro) deacylase [Oscillospiraceae bacterium]